MSDPTASIREIFRTAATFEDNPAIRHYGVAVDEASGEIYLVEAENGRVTGTVNLPREIAAQWIETLAAYLPHYRRLFGDRPYYPKPDQAAEVRLEPRVLELPEQAP